MKYLNNLGLNAPAANSRGFANQPMTNQSMPMTSQPAKLPMSNAQTYKCDAQPFANQKTAPMTERGGPYIQADFTPSPAPGAMTRYPDEAMVPMDELAGDMPVPETLLSVDFVPGFLRTQMGKTMRVVFFIGNQLTDRVGILIGVGASYILLQEVQGPAVTMCDLFSIKFVTILDVEETNPLLFT